MIEARFVRETTHSTFCFAAHSGKLCQPGDSRSNQCPVPIVGDNTKPTRFLYQLHRWHTEGSLELLQGGRWLAIRQLGFD